MSATLLVPAAILHTQGPLQIRSTVEFGRPVRLFRVDCACGYRSMWYSEPQVAFSSHARHVNGTRVEFR